MKNIFVITLFVLASSFSYCQKTPTDFTLSVSGGSFTVGHGYIKGIWTGVDGAQSLKTNRKKFLNKLTVGGEIFFENGADKATVFNPTNEQFVHDRYFHESNTGLMAKLSYYPFGGIMQGFHVSAGPLFVYSIRTYETRAQRFDYTPTMWERLSEIGSDDKLLGGYKIIAGYDIYIGYHWLAGVRADFLQYHGRDLNSEWGLKAGYRF